MHVSAQEKCTGHAQAHRPLAGIRVLDFTRVLAGPFATLMMADLGAEVFKIEDLEGSDSTRHDHPLVNGESHYFLSVNRNKQSIALDLKKPEAKEIVRKLVAQCDVVIENFRPGVMERLGFGYEALSALRPGLVYLSISAFGQDGPLRDKIAYDLIIQALTGEMDITGEPNRPPVKMGLPLADEMSGLFAVIGILAAMERRDRTGEGCYLDTAMFDVGLCLLSYMANIYFSTGASPERLGSAHPTIYPYNAFKTADSYVVVAPFTQAFWRKFCIAIGRPELSNDPDYNSFAARMKNRPRLAPLLESILVTRTTAHWLEVFESGDVPNGPVNTVGQALDMAQTRARGMVVEIDHPVAHRMRALGTPFHFLYQDGTQFQPSYIGAPVVGQHTQSILREVLGYPEAEIARLVAAGAVRTSEFDTGKGALQSRHRVTPAMEASSRTTPGSAPPSTRPLEGLRVIDLTRMFAGPFGTMLLCDLGAEVIKIEEPRIGDPTRRNLPIVKGESAYFTSVNRGKKSLALDLKTDVGRRTLLDLIAKADVVVENYRPGVMDRLGLSYEQLKAVKPDIIVCSISGFGQDGPLREKISFDVVNQAVAGIMSITGEEGRPPVRVGLPAGDLSGGVFGALAVLAALRVRRKDGRGSYIDLALHDLLVTLLGYLAQLYLLTGESPTPVGSGHHHIAPYRAFLASDGYIVISAFSNVFWVKCTRAIGMPELADDPRFCDRIGRKTNMAALDAIFEKVIRQKTVAEWIAIFEAGDVPCAPVASIGQALDSEHARARGSVFEQVHPAMGLTRTVASPFRANGSLWRAQAPSPLLDEHADDILSRILGYSPQQVASIRNAAPIANKA